MAEITPKLEVKIFQYPDEMVLRCATCSELLMSGRYAICIAIGLQEYLVEEDPPIEHCGIVRRVPVFIRRESQARRVAAAVSIILDRYGNEHGLRLMDISTLEETTIH